MVYYRGKQGVLGPVIMLLVLYFLVFCFFSKGYFPSVFSSLTVLLIVFTVGQKLLIPRVYPDVYFWSLLFVDESIHKEIRREPN